MLVLIALGLFAWAWFSHQRGQKSLAWPLTTGMITATGVRESTSEDSDGSRSTTCFPEVTYDYQVGGRNLSGSRIGVGSTSSTNQPAAALIANRYAVGSKVEVFYDPSEPAYAVLVRGTNSKLVATIAASGAIALVMAVVTNFVLRR